MIHIKDRSYTALILYVNQIKSSLLNTQIFSIVAGKRSLRSVFNIIQLGYSSNTLSDSISSLWVLVSLIFK